MKVGYEMFTLSKCLNKDGAKLKKFRKSITFFIYWVRKNIKNVFYFIIFILLLTNFSVIGQESVDKQINNEGNDTISSEVHLSDALEYAVINPLILKRITTGDSIPVTRRSKPYISEEPFSLLLPSDSAHVEVQRPTFIWESSSNSQEGLNNYEIYINDTLRHTCLDTSWTINYDLCEGYNDWYVITYDSFGNSRQSNEIRTVLVDVSPSLIEATTIWSDTNFTGPFPIHTNIKNIDVIDKVLLYFKHNNDPLWVSLEMADSGDGRYYAEITQSYIMNDTVKYYIIAKDIEKTENESTEPRGAPSNYYWFIANSISGISESDEIPESFSLCIKNCLSRDKVTFALALPKNAVISLRISDITGRLIDILSSGMKSAGYYEIPWVPNVGGVYFYTLESPWQKRIGKVVLIGGH